ncbi:hypothetical protein BR93DRAFT_936666 [Coniochaeta sp. PMI_546]|nr:hypothetical protein BR93DRAFT_936666 [Coniochaeta sp. PMI_546]
MAVSGAYARYAEQDEPGLYLVYPPDDRVTCTCDVFVIHGLHGGATKTWKHPDSGTIWFRDMLPGLIRSEGQGANARIWTYGYPANVAFQTSSIYDFAQTLLNRVKDVRKDNNALIEAKIHPRFSSISTATAGIVFMGTPHHGSGMADLGTIVSMVVSSAVPGSRIFNRDILRDLKKNNNTLFGISSQFSNICSGMTIHSFHETMPLGPTIIVDKTSAIMHLENEQKRDGLDQNWLSVGSSVVELVSLSAPTRSRDNPNVRRQAAAQPAWVQRQTPAYYPVPPAGTYPRAAQPNPGPSYATQNIPRRVPVPTTSIYTSPPAQRSATPTYAPPQLPPGWVAQWDVETGKYFFVERATGVVEWEPPQPRQPQYAAPSQRNDRLHVPSSSHHRSASADATPSRPAYPSLNRAHSREDFGASYRSQPATSAQAYQAYQPQTSSRPPPQSSVSAAPTIPPKQPHVQVPEDDESSNRESATCDGCMHGIKCSEPRVQCTVCYDYDLCIKCFQAGKETKTHKNTHKLSHILNTALIQTDDLIPVKDIVNPEFSADKTRTNWSISDIKDENTGEMKSYRFIHMYDNDSHARFLTSARPGHYAVSVVLLVKVAADINAAGLKQLQEAGAGSLRVSLGTVKVKKDFFGAALANEDTFNSTALTKESLPHRLLNHYWWDVVQIVVDAPYLHVQSDALLNIEGDESGSLTDLGLLLQWSGCHAFASSNDPVVSISVEHIRMDNLLDYNEPHIRAPAPAPPKPAPAPTPAPAQAEAEVEEEPTEEEFKNILLGILREAATAQERAALQARLEQQYREEEAAKRELVARLFIQALGEVAEEQERQERERQQRIAAQLLFQQQQREQRERQAQAQAAAREQARQQAQIEAAVQEVFVEAYLEQYMKNLGLR